MGKLTFTVTFIFTFTFLRRLALWRTAAFRTKLKVWAYNSYGSRNSSVTIVTRLRTGLSGVQILAHARASGYLFSGMSDPLWSPPSRLLNAYRNGRGVKFTTHVHLVSRLMCGGVPPLRLYALMACIWTTYSAPYTIPFVKEHKQPYLERATKPRTRRTNLVCLWWQQRYATLALRSVQCGSHGPYH
jgi:hypothetical protein